MLLRIKAPFAVRWNHFTVIHWIWAGHPSTIRPKKLRYQKKSYSFCVKNNGKEKKTNYITWMQFYAEKNVKTIFTWMCLVHWQFFTDFCAVCVCDFSIFFFLSFVLMQGRFKCQWILCDEKLMEFFNDATDGWMLLKCGRTET